MDFDTAAMWIIDKLFSIEMLTGIQFMFGGGMIAVGATYNFPGMMFGAFGFFLSGAMTYAFSIALKKILDDANQHIPQPQPKAQPVQKQKTKETEVQPYVPSSPNNFRTFTKL